MAVNVARPFTSQTGVLSQQIDKGLLPGTDLFSSRNGFLEGTALNILPALSSPSPKLSAKVTAQASVHQDPYYTVRNGDSLYRIAKQHEVTLSSLANANSIRIARRVPIQPGQQLKIPAVKDRAVLNEQAKIRMTSKLQRLAEGKQLSSSTEQLRASLVPKVPVEKRSAEDVVLDRRSNLVASVAVDSRPLPPPRSQNSGWGSLWQTAGLLLVGAAIFYFTKKKSPGDPGKVTPPLRKARALENSKLKLKPAPLPVSPPLRTAPPRVEAAAESAGNDSGALKYSRVGNTLFAVGSPRVLESMLSSSAQLPRVEMRSGLAPQQPPVEKAEARKVLEEQLAVARAHVLESQRRAELAHKLAVEAEEAKEAAWGTVERIRELSSINEEVLRLAEEALAEVRLKKELAASRI